MSESAVPLGPGWFGAYALDFVRQQILDPAADSRYDKWSDAHLHQLLVALSRDPVPRALEQLRRYVEWCSLPTSRQPGLYYGVDMLREARGVLASLS